MTDPSRIAELEERSVDGKPEVWNDLAIAYRAAHRMEEALEAFRKAIALNPCPEYLNNLALLYTAIDDHQAAIVCLMRAIGKRHDYTVAHLSLGQVLLATGEFLPGWREIEWGIRQDDKLSPLMTSMPWNGMHVPGRLFCIAGDGFGDSIMFSRYVPLLARRCEELVFGCSAPLSPLLHQLPGIAYRSMKWTDVPPHAAHVRLAKVPGLLGTTVETIPAPVGYLQAPIDRIGFWQAYLDEHLPMRFPRVGLAWRGRPLPPFRSMPLKALLPLAAPNDSLDGIDFISLQTPLIDEDDEAALAIFSVDPDIIANRLTDFGETAALIANLDLVITIDTSIAHLAAALGKPVWVMLSKAADWRWFACGEKTPWYPTARLFRQRRSGDWAGVVAAVAEALARHSFGTR